MSTSSSSSNNEICSICKSPEYESDIKCQNCFNIVCANCTINSVQIFSHKSGPGSYTVCSICFSYISLLESFIANENLSWSHLSERGSKWLELSGAKAWASSQDLAISTYRNLEISAADSEMISKDVESGRSDPETFNWEIKETLLRISDSNYRKDIMQVLQCYSIRNKRIGYCQGMNSVTVWLLIFLDLNSAFIMLCYLVEKWLLPDFYVGSHHGNSLNGFYVESTVIASILEHLIPSIKQNSISSNEFSDFFSLRHLIQIFVNTVDMQTTVFLWDKLAEEGSIALIRGVVSLVKISEKAVKNDTHPLQILKMLNENRVAPQVQEYYSTLLDPISQIRVEKLRKMATEARAKQWVECEKIVVRKLENASKFSKEEIEKLQERFIQLMKDMQETTKKNPNERRPTIGLPENLHKKMEDYKASHAIGITKPDFIKLLQEISPSLAGSGEELFETFDEDASGYLDFRELTIAMSFISKGDFEDKLRVCFSSYDSDKVGYLLKDDILLFIQRILTPYTKEVIEHPYNTELKEILVQINEKMNGVINQCNGKVEFNDFLNWIRGDLFLHNFISEYLGLEGRPQVSMIYKAMNVGTFTGSVDKDQSKCRLCSLL